MENTTTFLIMRQGMLESEEICAFCRMPIDKILITPCCESAKRVQEANTKRILNIENI